jgi:hypothetical protein
VDSELPVCASASRGEERSLSGSQVRNGQRHSLERTNVQLHLPKSSLMGGHSGAATWLPLPLSVLRFRALNMSALDLHATSEQSAPSLPLFGLLSVGAIRWGEGYCVRGDDAACHLTVHGSANSGAHWGRASGGRRRHRQLSRASNSRAGTLMCLTAHIAPHWPF